MISRVAVEDAIHAWAVSGTGLAGSRIIWSEQNGPRPDTPYVTLLFIGNRQVGVDWTEIEDVSDPDPGEEIRHKVRGKRVATLSVQCFGGDATGTSAPDELLEGMRSSARLPSVAASLVAVGLGVGEMGPVQRAGAVRQETVFEPRATMDVMLFVGAEVEELGTYISNAEVENQISGETFTVSDT